MGLFSWLTGTGDGSGGTLYKREPVKQTSKRIKIEDDRVFELNIVGEANYQDELELIAGGYTEKGHKLQVEAKLIYDDGNEYDDNAIAVEIAGEVVGYLSRQDATLYRDKMDELGYSDTTVTCQAKIIGGWDRGEDDRGHFGVKLYLPETFYFGIGKWVKTE